MKNFSTTNFITIFLVISCVWFIVFNLYANYRGVTIELNEMLVNFLSAFIWFVIAKKSQKQDGAKVHNKQPTVNIDPEDEVDRVLWTK